MRGGPSLKVKGGLVGFRRSLKAKGGLVGFRRSLKVQGSTFSFSKVQEITFIFSNVKKVLVGFRKTSLALREVFRKPHFKPYFLKNKAYFLIVSKKYQNLIRNPT